MEKNGQRDDPSRGSLKARSLGTGPAGTTAARCCSLMVILDDGDNHAADHELARPARAGSSQ
jgi:hypothetical protein